MSAPLISLCLPVKNGLPSLHRTLQALRHQTYQHFELIVQDAVSNDGSLDAIRGAGLSRVDIVSEPDTGHGQAFNRAWRRCRGELACMLACDEYLDDDALETFVRWHREHPDAAYCFGGARLWTTETDLHAIFKPGKFDLLKFLMNEHAPGQGGVYNRTVIGDDFYYDEGLKTCPDFEFLIRLGQRFGTSGMVEKDEVVHNSIRTRSLTTYNPASYDQIARDKLVVLQRFFDAQGHTRFLSYLHRRCIGSMYCWLAGLVLETGGETEQFYRYVNEAATCIPGSEKVERLVAASRGLQLDARTGHVTIRTRIQPLAVPAEAEPVAGSLDIASVTTPTWWQGAATTHDGADVVVTTSAAAWSYASHLPVVLPDAGPPAWYWLVLTLLVLEGQVGVGMLTTSGELRAERLLRAGAGPVQIALPVQAGDTGVLIRNGSIPQVSLARLSDLCMFHVPVPAEGRGVEFAG